MPSPTTDGPPGLRTGTLTTADISFFVVSAAVVVLAFALAGADPYQQLLLWVNTPGTIGLVTAHVDLFTGASTTVNTVPVSLAPAVFVLGLLLALRLRRTRPETYARFAAEPSEPGDPSCPHPTSSSSTPASATPSSPVTPPSPSMAD